MKLFTKEIEKMMNCYPLHSQDGKGKEAKVICKFFNPYGSQRWYVLEAGDPLEDGDRILYVLTTTPDEMEYGYIMQSDITETKVNVFGYLLPLERDRYFSGTVEDAMKDSMIHE